MFVESFSRVQGVEMRSVLKFLFFAAIAIFAYGSFWRPMLSTEVVRDETAMLQGGQFVTYDMNISHASLNRNCRKGATCYATVSPTQHLATKGLVMS